MSEPIVSDEVLEVTGPTAPTENTNAPREPFPAVNGNLQENKGEKHDYRLCLSPDCKWYIEFNQGDGEVKQIHTPPTDKPTHAVTLTHTAEIFRGRISDAKSFLTSGIDERRPGRPRSGEPREITDGYDDWYTDPTSRGLGC